MVPSRRPSDRVAFPRGLSRLPYYSSILSCVPQQEPRGGLRMRLPGWLSVPLQCRHRVSRSTSLALLLALALVRPDAANAQLNVSLQGIHMDPADKDAKDFSDASFGAGLRARFSIFHLSPIIGGGAGIEWISLLSETHTFQDPQTGLTVEQQTEQEYLRIYLGPEIGPRGA